MSLCDFRSQFIMRRPFAERFERNLISLERELIRKPHKLDFMRGLDSTAARSHGVCAREHYGGCRLGYAVRETIIHGLFYSELAGGYAAIFEYRRDQLVRALVFLPRANVGAELDLLKRAVFLESRSDVSRLAFRRKDHRKQSLADAPLSACEITQARTASHKDRGK